MKKATAKKSESVRTNTTGDMKKKIRARVTVYCEKPRSFAQILARTKLTESRARYLLRALMYEGVVEKTGAREHTVYSLLPKRR